jgi:thiamine biosynthesis lipoprotein ApbE
MKQLQLLMGMPITVEVVDPGVTEADIEKVFAYFRAVDATFSTYKEHSEISKINRGELCEEEFSDDMKTILALSEHTKADRFATAAFAMGKRGIYFIEQLPGFEGYVINASARATFTTGFERYVL